MLVSYIDDLKRSIRKTEKEILRIEEEVGLNRIIKSEIKAKFAKKRKYEKAVDDAKIALRKLNDLLKEYNTIVFNLTFDQIKEEKENKKLNKIEEKFMDIYNSAKKNLA